MCTPEYPRDTCANCADASTKQDDKRCGECLMIEMETKKPYQLWTAKEKKA